MKRKNMKTKGTQNVSMKVLLYLVIIFAVVTGMYGVYLLNPKINSAPLTSLDRSEAQVQTLPLPQVVSFQSTQAFNQVGTAKDIYDGTSTAWFGSDTSGYLGLQFSGLAIPGGGKILKATLRVTSQSNQWNAQNTSIRGDKSSSFLPFSTTSLPSARVLTTANVLYTDNVSWTAGTTYAFPDLTSVVQELYGTDGLKNISLVLKGNGTKYGRKFINGSGSIKKPTLEIQYVSSIPTVGTPQPVNTPVPVVSPLPVVVTPAPMTHVSGESMAMSTWQIGSKNAPYPGLDKCDDGTDIVLVHKMYYVVAYDGIKYPTWHPPVVKNPVTGVGSCSFGHEHGRNPSKYDYYVEIAQHYGKDLNGDGKIMPMVVSDAGEIASGDMAGLPFGIANEKMEQYYNQEKRDSIFVRHEDHVGHKVEYVNGEADMINHSTDVMGSNTSGGVNIPYYGPSTNNSFAATGVKCSQLHKVHQGTYAPDAIRNNLHEFIVHSKCTSSVSTYPGNTIIAAGMIPFGRPGEYQRFCSGGNTVDVFGFDDRMTRVCADGGTSPNCILNDPLISKLPSDRYPATLSRNMVDRVCLDKLAAKKQTGVNVYMNPYEIWEGTLVLETAGGKDVMTFGRQWEVLDPVRYADKSKLNGIGYFSLECQGLLKGIATRCDGRQNTAWDSRQSPFKGLVRSNYIGRSYLDNAGGATVYWTDPLGGNATTASFNSGLKQYVSSVGADMNKIVLPAGHYLNDRAIKRDYGAEFDKNGTVHAPN